MIGQGATVLNYKNVNIRDIFRYFQLLAAASSHQINIYVNLFILQSIGYNLNAYFQFVVCVSLMSLQKVHLKTEEKNYVSIHSHGKCNGIDNCSFWIVEILIMTKIKDQVSQKVYIMSQNLLRKFFEQFYPWGVKANSFSAKLYVREWVPSCGATGRNAIVPDRGCRVVLL